MFLPKYGGLAQTDCGPEEYELFPEMLSQSFKRLQGENFKLQKEVERLNTENCERVVVYANELDPGYGVYVDNTFAFGTRDTTKADAETWRLGKIAQLKGEKEKGR